MTLSINRYVGKRCKDLCCYINLCKAADFAPLCNMPATNHAFCGRWRSNEGTQLSLEAIITCFSIPTKCCGTWLTQSLPFEVHRSPQTKPCRLLPSKWHYWLQICMNVSHRVYNTVTIAFQQVNRKWSSMQVTKGTWHVQTLCTRFSFLLLSRTRACERGYFTICYSFR